MEALFWVSLFGAIYSYAIYPLILHVATLISSKQQNLASEDQLAEKISAISKWPRISHIITAHNEQLRIEGKIKNSLAIDYPSVQQEIIVASDCSSDETDEIVKKYIEQGVRLVRADEHNGKEYAQYLAIQAASGDILVFSDTSTSVPADSFKKLIAEFLDPEVGAVSSEDRFITDEGQVAGEGAYVRYEMWLRKLESGLAGLVGLSGSFFAARKEICAEDWDIKSPSDFNTALNCSKLGYKAVSSNQVQGFYRDVKDSKKEYQRKVRTVIRGITSISRHPAALNIFESGFFGFQVWSHKIMRWAVPWFLVLLLITNIALIGSGVLYNVSMLGQFLGYGAIAAAWVKPSLQNITPIKLGLFFIQVNLAIAHATISFFRGNRMTVWTPSKR